MRLTPLVLLALFALLTTGCTTGPFPVDVVVVDKAYTPSAVATAGSAVAYREEEHWLLLRGEWRWKRGRRHLFGTLERWHEVDEHTWGRAVVGRRILFPSPFASPREEPPIRAEVTLGEDGR